MKRFTNTLKWDDGWFSKLPQNYKLLWLLINDKCDNAGVWNANLELASFLIGSKVNEEEALKVFNDNPKNPRIEIFNEDKWLILGFINYQCGALNEKSPPHRHVMKLVKEYGLSERLGIGF